MSEFLEFEQIKKSIKTLNLDDFSVEDLNNYILELKKEIDKVEKEIAKKSNLLKEAQNYFK
tara:strand:- start:320 stop:502 length:183 start_codon:yes stop_codon:yes gene_type:complete